MLAAVFAGDRRVWRVAAVVLVVALPVLAYYSLKPRPYFTGTDSVEANSFMPVPAQVPLCFSGLQIPAGTSSLRLQARSATASLPALSLTLQLAGRAIASQLAPRPVPPNGPVNVDFPIRGAASGAAAQPAGLCVAAQAPVRWAVTYLALPGLPVVSVAGRPQPAAVAVWYLPRAGAQRSYLQEAGSIFRRAALFRPGLVGTWTYPVLLFLVLPSLAIFATRLLALAVAGGARRVRLSLYALAALNVCCWTLITPVFQGPDEVDHFAYTQSLVERGEGPSHDPATSPRAWSSAERLALAASGFITNHQIGDSRAPWLRSAQKSYEAQAATLGARARADGGGYTTSATHAPPYYLALAPAYLLARHGSVFAQLTLMRIASALLGALVVLFTYLLVRELAPGRQWVAVLAGLLVAFEPMYGFISGLVNNDVGVNAVAAAIALLLIRTLRRGLGVRRSALTGALLVLLPVVKGTGLSLYPVALFALAATLWRHHEREDARAWLALLGGAALAIALVALALGPLQPSSSAIGAAAVTSNADAASGALHHLPDYAAYVWQVFLPRLPFMAHHFDAGVYPAYEVFVRRGWGAFGWYTVFFPAWVYRVIMLAMIAVGVLGIVAAVRRSAWLRRHWVEALTLIGVPVAVVLGFEAAYYQHAPRSRLPEFGRYVFPAIAPLAAIVVGALHALRGRLMLYAGVALLVASISLSYASQLLTLTAFYA